MIAPMLEHELRQLLATARASYHSAEPKATATYGLYTVKLQSQRHDGYFDVWVYKGGRKPGSAHQQFSFEQHEAALEWINDALCGGNLAVESVG